MTAFFGRVKEFMGFGDSEEPVEETYVDYSSTGYAESSADDAGEGFIGKRRWAATSDPENEWSGEDRISRTRARSASQNLGGNVIGMPGVTQSMGEMVILKPQSFNEMAAVVQYLRDRKSAILNLTLMEPGEAQRSVDFVAGGTYAIDGHQERVGDNIFLFTPNCVTVSIPDDLVEELADEAEAGATQTIVPPTSIWDNAGFEELQAVGDR